MSPKYSRAFVVALLLVVVAALAALWHSGSIRVNRAETGSSAPAGFHGIAFAGDGTAFVSARQRNQVLRVSKNHDVTIFAGTGALGYGGDGGPAAAATLAEPMELVTGEDGTLLIADTGNNRIRQIDSHGTIRTIAGDGTLNTRANVLATAAGIYQPFSIGFDEQGNLLIGGSGATAVHRVNAITGIVTDILGANLPGVPFAPEPASGPYAIAAGEDRDVFVSDPSRNSVYLLDTTTQTVRRLAGSITCSAGGDGGPALRAHLCFPEGMAYRDRKLFLADTGNNRIRMIDMESGLITTIAGDGSDAYRGDGGLATAAALRGPTAVAIDPYGDLYIVDHGNDRIRKVNRSTGIITSWLQVRDLPRQ